jgi:hypothetical protein
MRAVFVRNGIPDGFMVRLANLEERHFPTATRVEEKPDGTIEIWFDRIFLNSYPKGEHLSHWRVVKERPKKKR